MTNKEQSADHRRTISEPVVTSHGIEVISVGAALVDRVSIAFGNAYFSLELFDGTRHVTIQMSPDEMDALADGLRVQAARAREFLSHRAGVGI